MKQMLLWAAGLIVPFLVFKSDAYARLDVALTVKTTAKPDGTTNYEYTLVNQPTSTRPVTYLKLDIGNHSGLNNISEPEKYSLTLYDYSNTSGIPCSGILWNADWSSGEHSVPLSGISPGSQVAFSFSSKLPPGEGRYEIWADVAAAPAEVIPRIGKIAVPGVAKNCE